MNIQDNNLILTTDSHNHLKTVHYNICDNTSSDEVKSMRGIIFSNDKIVCKSFPFTPEINVTNISEIETIINQNINKCKFYESHEGTLIRLWFYEEENKWYLSTHRKIDAFKSKWASNTSYGDLFNNIIQENIHISWADQEEFDDETQEENTNVFDYFCSTLNKKYIYTFLIRNTIKNRIVVNAYTKPALFCIGVFDRSNDFKLVNTPKSLKFSNPNEYKFTTIENLIVDIQKMNPYELQGLIMVTDEGKSIKLLNSEYDRLSKLRANVPSLEFRYIQLRNTIDMNDFIKLYSDHSDTFRNIEDILADISTNIFKKYIQRFIIKKQAVLPPCQYKIMTSIHKEYLSRNIPIVNHTYVIEYLNKCTDKELYYLYKNYIQNQQKYGNGNFISPLLKDKIISN